jgi:hypothetical protein
MKRFSRRTTILAALGFGALAGTGFGLTRLVERLAHRYPRTPYDDLLSQLDDRDAAVKVGRGLVRQFAPQGAGALASELRARLAQSPLGDASLRDSIGGAVVEANGWVVPITLARLCSLAAVVEHQA